jgi:hypothetical protein
VKYLLRKCEIFANANVGKFHFTLRRRSNISQFPKEIISHSAQAEYFTKNLPQQVADDIQGFALICFQNQGIFPPKKSAFFSPAP